MRAGTIYGPGRGTLNALREGRLRQIGDGANYTSRIQVDDLAVCLEAVAVRGRPGEVYLAVDDQPVSSATYYDDLAEAAGQDGPRVTPKPIARALVALFAALALVTRGASPLTMESRANRAQSAIKTPTPASSMNRSGVTGTEEKTAAPAGQPICGSPISR